MAVQCTEQNDEYPPLTVVNENRDPHTAPVGGIQESKPRIYISHADDNMRYVEYLRGILENHLGYQPQNILTLETDSVIGLPTPRNIQTLVDRSDKMIVVVSKKYTASHWTTFEMATILQSPNTNIANADIIPIISDDGSTVKELPDELSILIPLHSNDKHFIRRLGQSLEYSSNH